MKAIINGKTYNTETAREIGYTYYGDPCDRLYSSEETLYRTPRGNYFLHGEGGAGTIYGHYVNGNTGVRAGGERIVPMSNEDAFRWAESRLSDSEFEAEFGSLVACKCGEGI